jgi:hypothetical protein
LSYSICCTLTVFFGNTCLPFTPVLSHNTTIKMCKLMDHKYIYYSASTCFDHLSILQRYHFNTTGSSYRLLHVFQMRHLGGLMLVNVLQYINRTQRTAINFPYIQNNDQYKSDMPLPNSYYIRLMANIKWTVVPDCWVCLQFISVYPNWVSLLLCMRLCSAAFICWDILLWLLFSGTVEGTLFMCGEINVFV